jgi:hypothetical protein
MKAGGQVRKPYGSKAILASVAAALGVVLLGAPSSSQTGSSAASNEQLGHLRYEKFMDSKWTVTHSGDLLSGTNFFLHQLRTPASAEKVDIVATVTIQYRMRGRGDQGFVHLGFVRPGAETERSLDPRRYSYGSTPGGRSDTKTFVFTKQGVQAGGKLYLFAAGTGVEDGPDHGVSAKARGRKTTVVIEMWPAD